MKTNKSMNIVKIGSSYNFAFAAMSAVLVIAFLLCGILLVAK